VAHLPAQCAVGLSLKNSRGANVLELSEMLAGSTGLEPAASGVTGRRQRRHIAADPGKSGSAVPHFGRSLPIVDACFGTACKFLQAPARSGVNGQKRRHRSKSRTIWTWSPLGQPEQSVSDAVKAFSVDHFDRCPLWNQRVAGGQDQIGKPSFKQISTCPVALRADPRCNTKGRRRRKRIERPSPARREILGRLKSTKATRRAAPCRLATR
jgi:hypothetical protein